jgi:predicted PurR-regulated permease PerM
LVFWALGLPAPVLWGVVMMLLCTLPVVGAWLVWMPAAVGLALNGQYGKALLLALLGQFVVSSIDGLVRPWLVGHRAKLHELAVFFSVLGGLRYFGFTGIILGPAVLAITFALIGRHWHGALSADSIDPDRTPRHRRLLPKEIQKSPVPGEKSEDTATQPR